MFDSLQNDAIPEEEEGPVVEISHSASRDPTPRGMEDESRREIPDAYSTPPPPQKDEDEDDDEDDRGMILQLFVYVCIYHFSSMKIKK